jgi:hypothetical protein
MIDGKRITIAIWYMQCFLVAMGSSVFKNSVDTGTGGAPV